MRNIVVTALLASVGCSASTAAKTDDPQPEPPEPARFDRPAMVKFHMSQHFNDLRAVEQLLVAGELDVAKVRAFLLTRPAPDPGMARWKSEVDDVTQAARALANAPGIDEACRREARVAEACAYCHLHSQALPVFSTPPPLPPDDGGPRARMARHQWAVDRLWEGMVAPAEAPWRAGLDVLATTPLPFSPLTDAPLLANQLQGFARHALETEDSETLDDRTRSYGEMLVTCSACHATLHANRSASAR